MARPMRKASTRDLATEFCWTKSSVTKAHYVRVAVLVHELMHGRPGRDYSGYSTEECFEEEILAFSAQAKWWYEKFGRYGKRDPTEKEQ